MIDRLDIKYGRILPLSHTSSKPYSRKQVAEWSENLNSSNLMLKETEKFQLEWLLKDNSEWLDSTVIKSRHKPFLKVFYKEPANLFQVRLKNDIFVFKINPIFDLSIGYEAGEKFLFRNTRGVEFRASIKKRVSIYFSLWENQSLDPLYVRTRVANEQAVPGYGYWKEYRTRGFDFFDYRGYITVNALKHVDITFGHDKHFIGDGYRSLLLSDNSAPYFFLKLNTRIWKFNYQNIFAELTGQYTRGGDRLLDKKYAAFHHLSVSPFYWWDIGVFEGVIMTRKNQFDIQYLNPIIFYRSIEQSLGSPDNAFIGFNTKFNFLRHGQVYGQFMLDEFKFKEVFSSKGWWANKWGLQIGAKYIDVANVKNLDLQLEMNMVRPYTYTHNSSSGRQIANYTHYNQQLAHPFGANFWEILGIVKYQPIPQLQLQTRFFYAKVGLDTMDTNWGSDIFQSGTEKTVERAYGNKLTQGYTNTISSFSLMASYQLRHNLFFDFQYLYRSQRTPNVLEGKSANMFTVTARLNMPYRFNDF